ncbi:MAG: YihY/virulence factor BrkB family protein [Candidatus Eremiobacteraeota bacterium]|nr:YihY/virulence factor BrkB family protein [Candidatus Eremiobacteraeota bacterium]MBV8284236.1 YihY/virulence factor BrkB family protein [Candidatus Eremiobacteraeota bacterium]MBV8435272.1 YihY/virulence factor BrkB family protein [Candidatus Eremiobacteraeota bacterium]MBV8583063.1 YihY/virulence factor BrkB family protein [Candidatus Eremiobacteraeota bacterium]
MARFISALREGGLRFSRDGCAFLAQSIAFNALFALFPLTVLALSAATLVLPYAEHRTLAFFDTLAPALHDYIAANLNTYLYGRGITSLIAFLVLLWSGKNLFMGLAYALDRALGVPKGRPLVHNLALSFVMLPLTGLMLIVAISLPVLVSVTFAVAGLSDPARLTHVLGYALSIALVFIVTVALYRWLPNRGVSWGFAVRGATVVALAWPAVQYAFAQYTTHVDFTHVYGALSAPLVLLLWFYCIGCIFLYGAEYSAAFSALRGTDHVPAVADSP